MRQFPAFFRMEHTTVVVFGGGEEARRKVRLLAKTPSNITVIPVGEIESNFILEFGDRIEIVNYDKASEILERSLFAIIACRDTVHKRQAYSLVRKFGVPVNTVDDAELSDFTIPSILDRDNLVAGIATNGTAPVLAKSIRAKLEAVIPLHVGELCELAGEMRERVSQTITDTVSRRTFWEEVLTGSVAEKMYSGDKKGAKALFLSTLSQYSQYGGNKGVVHIVGAGPGDPELLTLKALRLLQEADIVYYDRLVSEEIISLIRRDADRVQVGKARNADSIAQEKIHNLLIKSARAGLRVVRLKGGDPFIFGRGGEELEVLKNASVEVHVVPGISSALGCAASAGISLTHRDHSQKLTFITGHAGKGGLPDIDWNSLSRPNQTVVIFMGVATSRTVTERLLTSGCLATTPVAIIENGTCKNERILRCFLFSLAETIEKASISGPALIIIGSVASNRNTEIESLSASVPHLEELVT